ncbi:MAG: fructose-bisphosphate aldolase, partial [Candidatus Omnitrophica bacterium]|nr:fructose-bisphosphate aldolase [Candidatus Omnitrophota bacterium]
DIPKGEITIENVQEAFYMDAQYGFQILNGNLAAAIDDYGILSPRPARFMNDLATYRIFVGWPWTVLHLGARVTKGGWLKKPKLTADGVIPGENAIELKAGTIITPQVFQQLWTLHNEWTEAFFKEQDRLAAIRLVAATMVDRHGGRELAPLQREERILYVVQALVTSLMQQLTPEATAARVARVIGIEPTAVQDELAMLQQVPAVAQMLSRAYGQGPAYKTALSLQEAAEQTAKLFGIASSAALAEIQAAAPRFDRSEAPVVMDILKRQLLSSQWLQHSARVLFEVADKTPAERTHILNAIFYVDERDTPLFRDAAGHPSRANLVQAVASGVLPQYALAAHDYVYDIVPEGGLTSAPAAPPGAPSTPVTPPVAPIGRAPKVVGLTITGKAANQYGDVLSRQAQELLLELELKFGNRREALLAQPESIEPGPYKIRDNQGEGWTDDEVFGRTWIVNAHLQSPETPLSLSDPNSKYWFVDHGEGVSHKEDSMLSSLRAVTQAVRGEGAARGLGIPRIMFRPVELAYDSREFFTADGEPVAGAFADLALYLANNAAELVRNGSAPAVLLPFIYSAEEARLWGDVIAWLETRLGLAAGTVKVYTLPPAVATSQPAEAELRPLIRRVLSYIHRYLAGENAAVQAFGTAKLRLAQTRQGAMEQTRFLWEQLHASAVLSDDGHPVTSERLGKMIQEEFQQLGFRQEQSRVRAVLEAYLAGESQVVRPSLRDLLDIALLEEPDDIVREALAEYVKSLNTTGGKRADFVRRARREDLAARNRERQIRELEQLLASPRYRGLVPAISAERAVRLRGTIQEDLSYTNRMADVFWVFMAKLKQARSLILTTGPATPTGEQSMSRTGGPLANYFGGWWFSAALDLFSGPDYALYGPDGIAGTLPRFVNGQKWQDQIQQIRRNDISFVQRVLRPEVRYLRPFFVDGDHGYGTLHAVIRNVINLARAGAAVIHIEDLYKKVCGHMGGKGAESMDVVQTRYNAARNTMLTIGSRQLLCGRTDRADAVKLHGETSPLDHVFIKGATAPMDRTLYDAINEGARSGEPAQAKQAGEQWMRAANLMTLTEAVAQALAQFAGPNQEALPDLWSHATNPLYGLSKELEGGEDAGGLGRVKTLAKLLVGREVSAAEETVKAYVSAVADAIRTAKLPAWERNQRLRIWQTVNDPFKLQGFHVDDMKALAELMGVDVVTDLRAWRRLSAAGQLGGKIFWNHYVARDETGMFQYAGSDTAAVVAMRAAAPRVEILWAETHHPDIEQIKFITKHVRAAFPDKFFAYNVSPSFMWLKLKPDTTDAEIAEQLKKIREFHKRLATEADVQFAFITYGAGELDSLSMQKLFKAMYGEEKGMAAYAEAQLEQVRLGDPFVNANTAMGTKEADLIEALAGGLSAASAEGTQSQFEEAVVVEREEARGFEPAYNQLEPRDRVLLDPKIEWALASFEPAVRESKRRPVTEALARLYTEQVRDPQTRKPRAPVVQLLVTVHEMDQQRAFDVADQVLGIALTGRDVSVVYLEAGQEVRNRIDLIIKEAVAARFPKGTEVDKQVRNAFQSIITRIHDNPFDRERRFIENLTGLGLSPAVAYQIFNAASKANPAAPLKHVVYGYLIAAKAWELFPDTSPGQFTLKVQRGGAGELVDATPEMQLKTDDVVVLEPKPAAAAPAGPSITNLKPGGPLAHSGPGPKDFGGGLPINVDGSDRPQAPLAWGVIRGIVERALNQPGGLAFLEQDVKELQDLKREIKTIFANSYSGPRDLRSVLAIIRARIRGIFSADLDIVWNDKDKGWRYQAPQGEQPVPWRQQTSDFTAVLDTWLQQHSPAAPFRTEEGAIGKGSAVAEWNRVQLTRLEPAQVTLARRKFDELVRKVEAAQLTKEEQTQASQVLAQLEAFFARGAIVTFNAIVRGPEDYLLAFADANRLALLSAAFNHDLFAYLDELLFHEGYVAAVGEDSYEAHQAVVRGLQRKLFGQENPLQPALRAYITAHLPAGSLRIEDQDAPPIANGPATPDVSINLAAIENAILTAMTPEGLKTALLITFTNEELSHENLNGIGNLPTTAAQLDRLLTAAVLPGIPAQEKKAEILRRLSKTAYLQQALVRAQASVASTERGERSEPSRRAAPEGDDLSRLDDDGAPSASAASVEGPTTSDERRAEGMSDEELEHTAASLASPRTPPVRIERPAAPGPSVSLPKDTILYDASPDAAKRIIDAAIGAGQTDVPVSSELGVAAVPVSPERQARVPLRRAILAQLATDTPPAEQVLIAQLKVTGMTEGEAGGVVNFVKTRLADAEKPAKAPKLTAALPAAAASPRYAALSQEARKVIDTEITYPSIPLDIATVRDVLAQLDEQTPPANQTLIDQLGAAGVDGWLAQSWVTAVRNGLAKGKASATGARQEPGLAVQLAAEAEPSFRRAEEARRAAQPAAPPTGPPALSAVEGPATATDRDLVGEEVAAFVQEYAQRLLHTTATQLAPPTGGILAADESVGTAAKRLQSVGLENTAEHRQQMRQVLLTTPGLKDAGISGVILDRDTLTNTTPDGRQTLIQYLLAHGIIPGLKTDEGLEDDPDAAGEKGVKRPKDQALTKLPALLQRAQELGLGFTKYRTTSRANDPPDANLRLNAQVQAKQAKLAQAAGLVPIVEPEVIFDGSDGSPATHDLATSYTTTTRVLDGVFEALAQEGVALQGVVLKTSMILAGKKAPAQTDPETVGVATLKGLLKTVPAEVPAIVFLSGGQADDQATANLDAVNRAAQTRFTEARDAAASELEAEGNAARAAAVRALTQAPWQLSYSFGRGLQAKALKAWAGQDANFEAGQAAMRATALEVQAARQGRLAPPMTREYLNNNFSQLDEPTRIKIAALPNRGQQVSALKAAGLTESEIDLQTKGGGKRAELDKPVPWAEQFPAINYLPSREVMRMANATAHPKIVLLHEDFFRYGPDGAIALERFLQRLGFETLREAATSSAIKLYIYVTPQAQAGAEGRVQRLLAAINTAAAMQLDPSWFTIVTDVPSEPIAVAIGPGPWLLYEAAYAQPDVMVELDEANTTDGQIVSAATALYAGLEAAANGGKLPEPVAKQLNVEVTDNLIEVKPIPIQDNMRAQQAEYQATVRGSH